MRKRWQMILGAFFVLAPVVALGVVGVLVLVFRRATLDTTFGVLILALCATLLAGAVGLVVSLKRASDLSRLQLDFLSKLTHEFKTPLTSIRMFAETLSENRLDTEQQRQRCVAMLRREIDRLSAMIERLLDFGRMEAGRMVYHRTLVAPGAIVEAAQRAFEPLRVREGVRLETAVEPDLPPIVADREMLTQALLNLLHNAYKYGRPGGPIRLECSRANPRVRFAVIDCGPGVPRRERRRIFEMFYRIDDRLSRKQEGSGLGLAIVRHVARAHGGRVKVQNRPEGGAEFSILLPAARGHGRSRLAA